MQKHKLLIAAGIGVLLECYDFMICAFMSTYLMTLFFPGQNFLGLFAIFTIAFFSRPLGGLFWGHLGDRYGRRKIFSFTMFFLVFPTLGIALFPIIPTALLFNSLGFIFLRFLQGFLVGGEFSGGVTFIAEIASSKNRGTTIASFMMAMTLGTVLASMIALMVNIGFSKDQILAWAWRIPFLISILLILTAIYIRRHIQETPFFQSLQKRAEISRVPLFSLLKNQGPEILQGLMITTASALGLVTLYLYLPQLFKNSAVFTPREILALSTSGSLILAISMPMAGFLADRFGRKITFIISMILSTVSLGLFYLALELNSLVWLSTAMILASICFSGVNANYCALLSELFPTQVRFSGVALCYNLAYALCGGILPLLYSHFAPSLGLFTLPMAFFVLITFLSLYVLSKIKDISGRDLKH